MVNPKTSSILLVHFIFLGLFGVLLSTNPESVIVQSPEDNEERIDEFRLERSQVKISTNAERPRRPAVVRFMKPFAVGSQIIWREVGRERIDRVWNYNPNQNGRTNYYPPQSMRPSFARPAERFNFRRTTENSRNLRRTVENNIFLRRITEEGINSRITTETSVPDDDSKRINKPEIPQNNAKGNNNNVPESSIKSFNLDTPKNVEPLPEANDQGAVTKSVQKVSPDSNFFAGIVNDFAFKLMDTLNLETNFVVSPLSIFIALSMCYLGSGGRTKAQMERVLGMDDNGVHEDHLHQGIKDLISLVVKGGGTPDYQLLVANGMFLGKNFTPNADFEKILGDYYRTDLKNLDFGNPESAMRAINDWVTENTRNMITNIINSAPPVMTPLILLNAVFFKGMWKMQFPLNLTYNGKFHSFDGTDVDVPFMTLIDETFPFYRSDEHRHAFVELPYKGDQMSMILALPYTPREKPMSSMRDKTLCYLRDAMVDTKLESVTIPKFHLEYSNSLARPLQQLGLTDIFDRNIADLSLLRKEKDVFVSSIFQKTVVEVSEEGTTASAVTEVRFVPLTTRVKANFVANHPFAFYIIHEPSGLVLFYGKIFGGDSESNVGNNRRQNMRTRPRPNSELRG